MKFIIKSMSLMLFLVITHDLKTMDKANGMLEAQDESSALSFCNGLVKQMEATVLRGDISNDINVIHDTILEYTKLRVRLKMAMEHLKPEQRYEVDRSLRKIDSRIKFLTKKEESFIEDQKQSKKYDELTEGFQALKVRRNSIYHGAERNMELYPSESLESYKTALDEVSKSFQDKLDEIKKFRRETNYNKRAAEDRKWAEERDEAKRLNDVLQRHAETISTGAW